MWRSKVVTAFSARSGEQEGGWKSTPKIAIVERCVVSKSNHGDTRRPAWSSRRWSKQSDDDASDIIWGSIRPVSGSLDSCAVSAMDGVMIDIGRRTDGRRWKGGKTLPRSANVLGCRGGAELLSQPGQGIPKGGSRIQPIVVAIV